MAAEGGSLPKGGGGKLLLPLANHSKFEKQSGIVGRDALSIMEQYCKEGIFPLSPSYQPTQDKI